MSLHDDGWVQVGGLVGADRWPVAVRELDDGPERDEAWTLANAVYPGYASYQQFTERRIPVAVLDRLG